MTFTCLREELSALLSAHDLPIQTQEEWVLPHGELPAIRATWFSKESSGRLEVDVLLDEERIIQESFVGIGKEREGIKDALNNFCINSLHVLLAAFWNKNDPDQVMTETWEINEILHTAFIGNFGTRGSIEAAPDIPNDLFDTIKVAIENETLNSKLSWFRCFFCDVAGKQTFEALKNNEVWDSGLTALQSLPWVKTNGYYSVRNFLIVKENIQ